MAKKKKTFNPEFERPVAELASARTSLKFDAETIELRELHEIAELLWLRKRGFNSPVQLNRRYFGVRQFSLSGTHRLKLRSTHAVIQSPHCGQPYRTLRAE